VREVRRKLKPAHTNPDPIKSEIRISKSETNPNIEKAKGKTKFVWGRKLKPFCLRCWKDEAKQICIQPVDSKREGQRTSRASFDRHGFAMLFWQRVGRYTGAGESGTLDFSNGPALPNASWFLSFPLRISSLFRISYFDIRIPTPAISLSPNPFHNQEPLASRTKRAQRGIAPALSLHEHLR
jgi:hypothetical protein